MLATPLAAATASLQTHLTSTGRPHLQAAAERIAYPALSAVVTACQIQTAWAVQGADCVDPCPSETFQCFWNPDLATTTR